jgi:hypothetical protein
MKNKKPFSIFFEVDHEVYVYLTRNEGSFTQTFLLACKMMWNIFAVSLIFSAPFIILLTIGWFLEQ